MESDMSRRNCYGPVASSACFLSTLFSSYFFIKFKRMNIIYMGAFISYFRGYNGWNLHKFFSKIVTITLSFFY